MTVLVLLAAFAALSWYVRRALGPAAVGSGAIAVLGRERVAPGHQLWLLDVGGHRVLLGSGRGGVQLLDEAPTPAAPPSRLSPELLARLPRIEQWHNEPL